LDPSRISKETGYAKRAEKIAFARLINPDMGSKIDPEFWVAVGEVTKDPALNKMDKSLIFSLNG
jgi:hypothetical protein